jgi:hypothetical protein
MAMTLESEEYNRIGIYVENVNRLVLDNVIYKNMPSIEIIKKNVKEVEIC